jgi:hypothetical protein
MASTTRTRGSRTAPSRRQTLQQTNRINPHIKKRIALFGWIGLAAVLVFAVFDAVPAVAAHGSASDNADQIAGAAASAAKNQPLTSVTAILAYNAAVAKAGQISPDIEVLEDGFKITPAYTAQVTIRQEVPSRFLKYVPGLGDWFVVTTRTEHGPYTLS